MSEIIKSDSGFTIENLTPELCDLRLLRPELPYHGFDVSNVPVLDFGRKQVGDIVQATLRIKGDNLKIYRTGAVCGCTVPQFQYDGEDLIVNVDYDTYKIKQNVDVSFFLYDMSGKKITLTLTMNN